MKKELITRLHGDFESHAHEQDGVEFWYARELQGLLGYTEWRNFLVVVEKARTACENAGQSSEDHFVDVNKMVGIGSGTSREIKVERRLKSDEKKLPKAGVAKGRAKE